MQLPALTGKDTGKRGSTWGCGEEKRFKTQGDTLPESSPWSSELLPLAETAGEAYEEQMIWLFSAARTLALP